MEQWKPIAGFSAYQVSNQGRIVSYYRSTHGRVLKPAVVRRYKRVCFYVSGMRFFKLVHILVATTFIPNPQGLPEVNHKNFDKMDCRVDNLEWMTAESNRQHATAAGRNRKPHTGAAHIYYRERRKPYSLVIQGKYRGSFSTESQALAAEAYILENL